jgi:HJR/Mrr/RecB family endonuclease
MEVSDIRNENGGVVSKLLPLWGMPFRSPIRAALALVLFAGGVSSSRALQLGETQAQIVARHGAPAVEDHGRQLAMYYWAGWSARLEFHGGVVEKLIYKKNEYLSVADIASLLQANGGAKRWRETTTPGADTRQWARDDGAVASCDAARAIGMVFQNGHAVISTLEQAGAGPKAAAASGVPSAQATLPPAPQFFPDPLAVQSKPDPKLSEISVPAVSSDPGKARPAAVASAETSPSPPPEHSPVKTDLSGFRSPVSGLDSRPVQHSPVKFDSPPSIDPPALVEPLPAPAAASPEAPQIAPAPPAAEGREWPGRIVALGCLIFGVTGALILLYKSLPRRRSRDLSFVRDISSSVRDVSEPPKGAGLDALRWDQVELLIGELYRRVGYTVELSAGLGAENGIDLTLRRNTETVLVQCKHWKTLRVAEREMREFYGAMASSGSPRGIFVTMGGVTRGAREFAEGKGIDLIDRKTLEERIAGITHPGENLCLISGWIEEFAAYSRIFDPECPMCREPMTLRSHPAGHSAFWGCRNYPRCTGKREPRRDLLELVSARQMSSTASAV